MYECTKCSARINRLMMRGHGPEVVCLGILYLEHEELEAVVPGGRSIASDSDEVVVPEVLHDVERVSVRAPVVVTELGKAKAGNRKLRTQSA